MTTLELVSWYPVCSGYISEIDDFTKNGILAYLKGKITDKKVFKEFCMKLYWFIHGSATGLPVMECMEILGKPKSLEIMLYNFQKLMSTSEINNGTKIS